jgi:hypothetical protein
MWRRVLWGMISNVPSDCAPPTLKMEVAGFLERFYLQPARPNITVNRVSRIMLGVIQTRNLMHCYEEGVKRFDIYIRPQIEGSYLK